MNRFLSLLLCLAISAGVLAKDLTVPLAVDPKGFQQAAISPDGKHVAAVAFTGYRYHIVLIELDKQTHEWIVNGNPEKGSSEVSWITNDLLAVQHSHTAESIDLAGNYVHLLGDGVLGKVEPDNPESTMMLVITDGQLARVDARKGGFSKFKVPMPGKLYHWAFDPKGVLRAVTMKDTEFWNDKTTLTNWYRASASADWVQLAQFRITEPNWLPYTVPDGDNQLTVASDIGRDTRAIFAYDVRKRTIGELLFGHSEQDVTAVAGLSSGQAKLLVTAGMKPEHYWLDPAWLGVQRTVDAALPGCVNQLSGNPAGRVLVRSYSDIKRATWYVLDTRKATMAEIGSRGMALEGVTARPQEIVRYAARDGLTIPAYLTRPSAGAREAPTVILIHGGPTVRDEWGWNADVQLLAARGYVVLQPQFRGSAGFGRKFEEAGYRQWGKAMQDDVTDGVRWLIREGIADPDRICIYGASYGGYAALWGLVQTPELYRCGISFAGVSDLGMLYSENSDTARSAVGRELMRFMIGDAYMDAAAFDAVSPLKHAASIRSPVLLMHGYDDFRVPITHGRKMARELGRLGKTYEWHVFDDAGHGLSSIDDLTVFYEKLFAFLDRYLGPGQTAASDTPSGR